MSAALGGSLAVRTCAVSLQFLSSLTEAGRGWSGEWKASRCHELTEIPHEGLEKVCVCGVRACVCVFRWE